MRDKGNGNDNIDFKLSLSTNESIIDEMIVHKLYADRVKECIKNNKVFLNHENMYKGVDICLKCYSIYNLVNSHLHLHKVLNLGPNQSKFLTFLLGKGGFIVRNCWVKMKTFL